MKNLLTLLLFGCFFTLSTTAQVVYNLVPSTTNADNGQTVTVDLTVENFTNMIGFQYNIKWNQNVLQFQDITTYGNITCNAGGPGSVCWSYPNDFGPASISNYFVSNYTDPLFNDLSPNTIPDGGKLLTIEFLVVGSGGQFSDIEFDTQESVLAVNSNFQELSLNNGMLSINNGTINVNGTGCFGVGDVTFNASNESGDTGTNGSVKISVDNFENVEGFGYTLNWDPTIISFDSIGSLNLNGLVNPNPPAVGSFGTTQTSNGNLFVSWGDGTPESVCDGTVIFEIFYSVIGGGGTSTDVDFTGNIEVIKSTGLVPHVVNSGSVTVTGNGNPINGIGFIAGNESADNGQQVCVPISVSNFNQVISFQYELEWDETVMTYNSILDGAGNSLSPIGAGNPLGLLNPNPPAVGNFGTTNVDNGVISLSWDNASGSTLSDNTPIYQVCFDVIGQAAESSTIDFGGVIEVVDQGGIADFTGVPGSVTVTGTFTGLNIEWDCCQEAQVGENVCIDVRVVNGFTNLLSTQYGLTWDDSVLDFTGFAFNNGNPLALSVGNNLIGGSTPGEAKVFWFDNSQAGVTLQPETSLFQVCFDVTNTAGASTTLEFADLPNAVPPFNVEISDTGGGAIPFLGDACTITAADIPAITISLDTNTSPSCIGSTDGALDISVSGGVVDYTFAWSTGETSEDITGLSAGDYTVTVTDCRGITATQTYSVVDPSPITITASITDESGFGNDGEISLNVNGGTGTYTTYVWSPNVSTSSVATGLSTDTYDVTVTDSNGCTGTATFEVGEICANTNISITASITDVSGAGNDGAIDISLNGGATPFSSFAWSNSANTEDINSLAQGTYTVTATDANGCEGIASFIVGTACQTFSVTGTVSHETSAGNDGAINVQPTGIGYNYAWTPNLGNISNPSGLAPGVYTVIVSDPNNCTGTNTFTIDAFNCPAVSVSGSGSHVTCAGGSDGTASASATGGNGNFDYVWSNGSSTFNGQNIANLAPGTYTVTATDTDGCFSTATVTINDGAAIGVNIVSTQNLSCFNNNTGSITVQGTGGTGPYSYNWNLGNSTTGTNAGLAAGTYAVTATDANGCSGSISGINLTQPADISITGTANDVDCNGGNNGSINLNITGGTSGYSVAWSNGGSGQNLNNLTAGSYTPTVTDANGCVKVGPTFTVGEPTALNIAATVNDASCFDECDGSVSLIITGGTSPYTVNWSDGQVGPVATGLCDGVITVGITDANGCTFSDTYTIDQPDPFTLDFDVTDETTAGSDGAIDLTVLPIGSYSYAWTAANQTTTWSTEDLNNIIADVYTVVVTDNATQCTTLGFVAISNSLGLQSEITEDVTCFEGNNGSIDLEVSGGEEPYTYLWDGPTGNPTTQDLFNLVAGTYSVTISDAEGTQLFENFIIGQPSEIVITNILITDEVDDCDGKINISVEGGTPPYNFVWNTTSGTGVPITVEDPMDLCDGFYNVTISDAYDCFIVSQDIEVGGSLPQLGLVQESDVSCNGGNDGIISINLLGGDAPYTITIFNSSGMEVYSSTGNSTSVNVGGLGADTYTVVLEDNSNQAVTSIGHVISEPSPIEITNVIITNQSATVCDGSIDITVAGGTQPYTYQWNFGPTQPDLFNLCMGNYDVTITDANGCVITSPVYEVTKTIEFSQIVTPVTCFGDSDGGIDFTVAGGIQPYVYSWVDANGVEIATTEDLTNVPAGVYGVMVTDDNGNGTQIFSGMIDVSQPDLLDITDIFSIQPSITNCNDGEISIVVAGGTQYNGNPNYDFLWEDENGNSLNGNEQITNLVGGTYYVTVSDANGCTTNTEISLQGCQIESIISSEDITCFGDNNGSASVTPTNGTADYTYNWSNGGTGNVITNLTPGDYTVTITDANGVEGINVVTIIEPASLEVEITVTPGRAEAVVLGGTAPYTYQWSSLSGPSTDAFIEGLKGGTEYALVVTDSNGCQSIMESFRSLYDGDCMTAREVISPNDDSFNDVFYVNCVEDQPVKVTIFNRWGEEVFQSDEYDNSWAGTGKRGELLPEGGYMYILEFETSSGGVDIIKGSLSLIR